MFISTAYAQGATEAASVAAEHGKRVFPPFDFSFFESHLFWLIVCFGLFYLFMARVVLPRIGGIIEQRRDRIAADLDHAARMKEEADAAVAAYEKKLAEARENANAIARSAGDEARLKAEAERHEAQAGLDARLAEAEKHIAQMRDKAMQNVEAIAEETAVEIVHKLVGSDVNKVTVAEAVKAARADKKIISRSGV